AAVAELGLEVAGEVLVEPHPAPAQVRGGDDLVAPADATPEALCDALLSLLFASQAQLAIVPMQDLLQLDSQARMNLPGRAEGNWSFRLPAGALSARNAEKLRRVTEVSGRAP
ncbi:MAG TPA: 4-alpha-glucanotransferase, partial [Polyangiales bacterium]